MFSTKGISLFCASVRCMVLLTVLYAVNKIVYHKTLDEETKGFFDRIIWPYCDAFTQYVPIKTMLLINAAIAIELCSKRHEPGVLLVCIQVMLRIATYTYVYCTMHVTLWNMDQFFCVGLLNVVYELMKYPSSVAIYSSSSSLSSFRSEESLR